MQRHPFLSTADGSSCAAGGSAPSARSRAACSASASTSGPTAATSGLHIDAQTRIPQRFQRFSGRWHATMVLACGLARDADQVADQSS